MWKTSSPREPVAVRPIIQANWYSIWRRRLDEETLGSMYAVTSPVLFAWPSHRIYVNQVLLNNLLPGEQFNRASFVPDCKEVECVEPGSFVA